MTDNYGEIARPEDVDPAKDAAEAMAAEVADVMRLLGKVHAKLATNGFTDATRNKFLKMSKQLYYNMKIDLPSLYRTDLVSAIEEDADAAL